MNDNITKNERLNMEVKEEIREHLKSKVNAHTELINARKKIINKTTIVAELIKVMRENEFLMFLNDAGDCLLCDGVQERYIILTNDEEKDEYVYFRDEHEINDLLAAWIDKGPIKVAIKGVTPAFY